MHADLHTLKKGFTIIELSISMALITLILAALLFTFKFQYDTYDKLYHVTSSSDNLRYLSIVLETQIRTTPILYSIDGCIYLKDLESPEYFNTYTLNDRMVYKIKTDADLVSIGSGSTSQMTWNVDCFYLTLIDQNRMNIAISTTYEGKTIVVDKDVKIMGKVIVIDKSY